MIRERLGELDHAEKVVDGKPLPVLGGQLSGQRPDNLLPLFGAFLLKNFATDAVADAPIEQHQRRIDGSRRGIAGLLDEGANVRQQFGRKNLPSAN